MKKLITIAFFMVFSFFISESQLWATNGAQVIGVGPISRSMGGTGIANPQSAVSGIYLNPGAMIFANRMDFGASILKFNATGTLNTGATAESEEKIFLAPSLGAVMHPLEWMAMGMAVVQVVGVGTDYRSTALSAVGRLQITQTDYILAGALKLKDGRLGIGFSIPISYQEVDTGTGVSTAVGIAAKLGVGYEIKGLMRLGAYFKTPQFLKPKHNIIGVNSISAPMEFGLGLSLIKIKKLVLSLDAKYIFWDSADGYGDATMFNWKNQFVIGFGVQYGNADDLVMNWLILRAGYNFGSSPLRGTNVTNLPAVVKHHISLGLSVDIGLSMHLNFGGVLGLKANQSDNSGNKSEANTWSIDMGMSGIFG